MSNQDFEDALGKASPTDLGPLGKLELADVGDIFRACDLIRDRASESGLIVLQLAQDVEWALADIRSPDGGFFDSPTRRAQRVARHLARSAEALRSSAMSAAKLPPVYKKVYADVIQHRRSKTRPRFDPTAGL